MKYRQIFTHLAIVCFLFACSKNGYVRLNYPQEPQVYLPDGIERIAVINRSLTSGEGDRSKIFEAVTSGEVAGSDRLASDECIRGILDAGHEMQGVEFVVPNPSRYLGTGTREMPEMMDWELVQNICNSTDTDALLVLEVFDSNSDLLRNVAIDNMGAILSGRTAGGPVVPREVNVNVRSYWRMYDPINQAVIDHFNHTSFLTIDPINSILPSTALAENAHMSGQDYIYRFLPSYYTVRRELYKKGKGKGKNELESGYRRAEVANWKEAIDIWEAVVGQGSRKNSGRACVNIAVGYEVLGETDRSLEWAQRAYQDYNDELGRDYAKLLLRRQAIEQ